MNRLGPCRERAVGKQQARGELADEEQHDHVAGTEDVLLAKGTHAPNPKRVRRQHHPVARAVNEVQHVALGEGRREVRSAKTLLEQQVDDLADLGAGEDLGQGHGQGKGQVPSAPSVANGR